MGGGVTDIELMHNSLTELVLLSLQAEGRHCVTLGNGKHSNDDESGGCYIQHCKDLPNDRALEVDAPSSSLQGEGRDIDRVIARGSLTFSLVAWPAEAAPRST